MGNALRKLERARARDAARARTRRGLCSRCGQRSQAHPAGRCPDGQGNFTWAMNRNELEQAISKLEQVEASVAAGKQAAGKPVLDLTRDEQRVLDYIVDASLGFPKEQQEREFAVSALLLGAPGAACQPPAVAAALGLPLHHVRSLLDSLVQKGCLARNSGAAS